MSAMVSYSATLLLVGAAGPGREIVCRACSTAICGEDAVWKDHAILEERPLADAGGPAFRTDSDVVFRQFYCPSCGTTLDAETALPGEPFLIDRVKG